VLVVLIAWLPKASALGVRNTGVGGVVPVPESVAVDGVLGLPLLAMLSVAVSAAAVDGLKLILTVHVPFAAIAPVQVELVC
jgi:hypothetical protein